MKSIRVKKPGGLDKLSFEDMDPRKPGINEIQVEIKASSLNFHDYLVAVGLLPVDEGRIPLSDGAGIVSEVGAGVESFSKGDRVLGYFFPNWDDGSASMEKMSGIPGDNVDGFASQMVTMSASAFGPMPENLDFLAASTLPCAGLTAWRAMMVEAHLRPGDWILTQGTGGVSIFAIQFAKMMGCKIVATSSSQAKLDRLKKLGVDEVINYRENSDWGNIVNELTGGKGVNLVVEVGGSGTIAQSVRAVSVGGIISMIGVLTGFAGDVPLAELFQKNARIVGITVGSKKDQKDMISAVETNGLNPVLDKTFNLENLADAFKLQESQQHFGKIGVQIE